MDVAGAFLDRVGQDQIDQLYDRRFLAGALQLVGREHRFLVGFLFQIQFDAFLLDLGDLFVDFLELDRVRCAVVFFQRLLDRDLGCHHRFHVESRHELDVVHGEYVRRIRGGDGQSAPDAAQRDDHVLLRGLDWDQLNDDRVDLEIGEVDRRDAVLLAQDRSDIVVLDISQVDENRTQAPAAVALMLQRSIELFGGDVVLFYEQFADLRWHGYFILRQSISALVLINNNTPVYLKKTPC